VEDEGLNEFVEIRNESSVAATIDPPIDMLLLDSELTLRVSEFEHFRTQLSRGAIVIFHDTSTIHRVVREGVTDLVAKRLLTGIMFPSPRGLAICQYQGDLDLAGVSV
jgi:hypothetical protein